MMTMMELDMQVAHREELYQMESRKFPKDEINRILLEGCTDEWLEATDNVLSILQR